MSTQPASGYSAKVELRLRVDGREFRVSQVGPNSLMLREPCDLPPSNAEIIIKVDEHEEVDSVYLFQGASKTDREVRFY